MAKDIKVDFFNRKLINKEIDRTERVLQQIRVAVQTWTGDWLLDQDEGIDYDLCWGDIVFMEMSLREAIRSVDGVDRIVSLKMSKKKDSYDSIVFVADVEVIIYNETFVINDLVIGY